MSSSGAAAPASSAGVHGSVLLPFGDGALLLVWAFVRSSPHWSCPEVLWWEEAGTYVVKAIRFDEETFQACSSEVLIPVANTDHLSIDRWTGLAEGGSSGKSLAFVDPEGQVVFYRTLRSQQHDT
ncbi:unnamed protein product [Vitrella brassicaformis CCMP3155]|uniref:Uncharacterized protein n=1 Tax=Vitrella brassicaformis (strain CCMP3155) TaxID=1169540 RepID=A0A0G4ESJ1_VITBC|nr:unnamed protein product [Vitrella brassicaformis CCMP3155]|eukprot:CEM00651.1 unnamed protein product [Vitrella brassicaformis CCMP3155]